MNLDLSGNNGPDTYTVSQNSPLFDLLDHIVGSQASDTALATLVEYANHLSAAVEEQVAQCRADGVTWQAIADRLGTTRQAAHQRYGSAAPAPSN